MAERLPVLKPWRMHWIPALGALALALLSLTPSMLPRTAVFQGVLCALAALLGYAAGALIRWLLVSSKSASQEPRAARQQDASSPEIHSEAPQANPAPRTAGKAAAVLGVVLSAAGLVFYQLWQNDQREQLAMPHQSAWSLVYVVLVGVVLLALLLVICRFIRKISLALIEIVDKVLPRRVAAVIVVAAMVLGLAMVGNRAVVQRVAGSLDNLFLSINDEFLTDLQPPHNPELSAGPGSSVSWADLGRQGRLFISNTPNSSSVAAFSGKDAKQPIRVYAGAGKDGNTELPAQAALAVEELRRTGAFNRAVLNVATGTGRGWVNENQIQALEYMWGGDTATVSMQYSYLPSWMSFLMDSSRAQDAGRLLFDAVYRHWVQLPAKERPKLVVSGESLGSFGAEAAFSGAQDFATRTDGALFVGPAAGNRLWQRFTDERDPGSPAVLPVYENGDIVRFSADGVHWPGSGTWGESRIGYLQHSNDPISWGDVDVFISKPDWLRAGQRPGNIPSAMVWIPVVTGLQLLLDQVASGIPDGQGHEFGQVPVRAWAQILPSGKWTDGDTERLVELLEQSQPAR